MECAHATPFDTAEVHWTHERNTYQDLWTAAKERAANTARAAAIQSRNAPAPALDLFQAILRATDGAKWDGFKSLPQNRFVLMPKSLLGVGGEYRATDKALVGARITLSDFQTFVEQFPGHEWLMESALWKEAVKQCQPSPKRKWFLFR
jgi:hypothetical protein